MTRDRILAYARELEHLVSEARSAEAAIDRMNMQIDLAKRMQDAKQVEQFIAQRMNARKFVDEATKAATEKANRPDLAGCERLLEQLEVRLEQHQQFQRDLAQAEARFEAAATMGEFDDERGASERKDVEEILDTKRKRVVTQLELASALVPDKPVVLTLS